MKKNTMVSMGLLTAIVDLLAMRSNTPRKARGMRRKPRTRKGTMKTLSVNGKPIGRPRKIKAT